jgi:hypothetical protein
MIHFIPWEQVHWFLSNSAHKTTIFHYFSMICSKTMTSMQLLHFSLPKNMYQKHWSVDIVSWGICAALEK